MKKDLKVFSINLDTSTSSIESYNVGDFFGPADLGFHLSQKNGSLNIGTGLFADSRLSGSNRLVFSGQSPCWDGFYISTMGGAGLIFESLEISMLSLVGKTKQPSVIYMNQKGDGKIELEIENIEIEAIWADKSEDENGGVYSLMETVLKNYENRYEKEPRILAVGKSAKTTDFGAVCSAPIKKGKVTPVDTWAGRGGFGSKMYQDHGIVAIIYGGVSQTRGFRDIKTIDKWFENRYDMNFKTKDKKVTAKYSYVDILKSGGTLGVNYSTLGAEMLSFNYQSVNKSEDDRLDLSDNFIKKHYLKQFNEETIETKNQKTCGEPCSAMCKKMNGKFKKDYEPYQTMGPLSGIFDQRAAEKINRYSDAYGFDAISIGGVIAWIMECLTNGYLTPKEAGVKNIPKFSEKDGFDVVATSMYNANIGIDILDSIIEQRALLDLSGGARVLAHKLSKLKTKKILDCFVFNANGKKGWMVPNQYWTPGVLSPMALMGKYYMYYGNDFMPPRELGLRNAQRFVAELMIDNIAVCRFHRGWAEDITPEIIGHLYDKKDEFIDKLNSFALKLNAQGKPVYWESKKNTDIIYEFLKRKKSAKYSSELEKWIELFDKDTEHAAEKFWNEIYEGVQEYFNELQKH